MLNVKLGHHKLDASGKEIFKIVKCGSKGLTSTQHYSTIELECLTIVWAIFKVFILSAWTAFFSRLHRPLEGIFVKDIFDLASPRLHEKVTMYTFNVRWVPGKTHYIADALS